MLAVSYDGIQFNVSSLDTWTCPPSLRCSRFTTWSNHIRLESLRVELMVESTFWSLWQILTWCWSFLSSRSPDSGGEDNLSPGKASSSPSIDHHCWADIHWLSISCQDLLRHVRVTCGNDDLRKDWVYFPGDFTKGLWRAAGSISSVLAQNFSKTKEANNVSEGRRISKALPQTTWTQIWTVRDWSSTSWWNVCPCQLEKEKKMGWQQECLCTFSRSRNLSITMVTRWMYFYREVCIKIIHPHSCTQSFNR